MTGSSPSLLDELAWRGLLHQATSRGDLERHLETASAAAGGRVAYAGFDPTSDSLHIGNFIPIKLLMHWQQAGHTPIAVMGGGTGLIGDPSGRSTERTLMSREEVEANVASQRRILERFLDFAPGRRNAATLVNNIDWLEPLGFIEVLRDVGKHFSVNEMIQRDSVRRRLEEREHGISYTEFSYAILQAYDFLHLRRERNCTVQLGGADQYGNIVAGIELIRREYAAAAGAGAGEGGRAGGSAAPAPDGAGLAAAGDGREGQAFGITAPLIGRSDGRKMSKSEGTAIWLSADTRDRTSPYAFYQFWLNVPDADAVPWLKVFTTLERGEIDDLARQQAAAPHERPAQRALAREMTRLAHGAGELARADAASQALFTGDVRRLEEGALVEVFAEAPHSGHGRGPLEGPGVALVELLPQTSLASSKREAREFLSGGAVLVNGEKADLERRLTTRDLLHGRWILLKRGKKNWHVTRWE
jgi:tyrosyl-tRNA synthetase